MVKINIHEFAKKFNEEYDFCYEHYDRVAGFGDAVQAFDKFLNWNVGGFKDFVHKFAEYRHDFITSDREAAAFMFALDSMGAFDECEF